MDRSASRGAAWCLLAAAFLGALLTGSLLDSCGWPHYLRQSARRPLRGVLHSYLLVVGWRLFGLDPDLPRILALVAGAATVPAAYWLGRELRDRTVGLVAAVLVGATAYHILIASHVGWSHCLTPLF